MTYKPQERDVILVPLGVYEALRLIQQEKQNFQAGIKTYLEKKQDLATLGLTQNDQFSQDSAEYAFGILHWLETAPTRSA